MQTPKEGYILRIFPGENNKYGKQPLYERVVLKARDMDRTGAIALHGIMEFGSKTRTMLWIERTELDIKSLPHHKRG